jgi:hypothetical protein
LDGSVHGKESVGDDFEAVESRKCLRANGYDPGGLHLRQAGDLAQAADHKYRNPIEAGREGSAGLGEAVVQKNLVHDQRQVKLAAQARQFFCLPGLGEVAGGVVGVDQDDGAC